MKKLSFFQWSRTVLWNTGDGSRTQGTVLCVEQDPALRKVLKGGVSIRQASRLTGISTGMIRKFSKD